MANASILTYPNGEARKTTCTKRGAPSTIAVVSTGPDFDLDRSPADTFWRPKGALVDTSDKIEFSATGREFAWPRLREMDFIRARDQQIWWNPTRGLASDKKSAVYNGWIDFLRSGSGKPTTLNIERLAMNGSIWTTWFGLKKGPAKRRDRGLLWQGLHAERLEDRALLTARAFDFPSVAGSWDLEVDSEPGGTATLTQDGKKVNATVNVTGLPTLILSDKFTKKDPDTLSGKIKIKDEELGKFTIDLTVTFGAATGSPTTFTGSAVTPQGTTNFTGIKQGTGNAPLPKAAPVFENVAGTWQFEFSQPDLGTFQGTLTIAQSGKGGKNVDGTVALVDGPTITFSAKFEKKDPSTVSGTLSVPVEELGRTLKGKLTAQFNIEFDAFGGTATLKQFDPAEFSATRITM